MKKFVPVHHRGKVCFYDEVEVEEPESCTPPKAGEPGSPENPKSNEDLKKEKRQK